MNISVARIQDYCEASQAAVRELREQKKVHATDTPASNTSGVLIDEDKKANAVLDIGAKWRVLGPLVDSDNIARFTGDGEVGKAEARAIGSTGFAAVEGIALGA